MSRREIDAQKMFIVLCSSFNSASNHALRTDSQRFSREIIEIESRVVTLHFVCFEHDTTFNYMCQSIFNSFYSSHLSHISIDRVQFALRNCMSDIFPDFNNE